MIRVYTCSNRKMGIKCTCRKRSIGDQIHMKSQIYIRDQHLYSNRKMGIRRTCMKSLYNTCTDLNSLKVKNTSHARNGTSPAETIDCMVYPWYNTNLYIQAHIPLALWFAMHAYICM